jgi:LacI family transcriptional regulator
MSKRLQKGRPRHVGVLEVAALAGCSTASVSRVLNQPEAVGDEVTSRVYAAMRKLGYMPNSAARTLRSRRSHIMGIVIPTLDYAIYARLVEGLQQQLAERGYSLLVATSEYDLVHEAEHARLLMERGVDGLVLIGDTHRPELYHLLETTRLPYVNTYVYRENGTHPSIGFDNRRVTSEITDFLWGLGHRAFGVISASTSDNDRASERVAGVKDALERHGSSLLREAVYEHPYSIASGREGFRYLRTLGSPPTAIICGNDVLAMGALIEAHALAVKVPEDVSIVGFDNLEFASHLDPPLTTVDVPAREMGTHAADFLVQRVMGQSAPQSMLLEPRLIVRRTSANAPTHKAFTRRA